MKQLIGLILTVALLAGCAGANTGIPTLRHTSQCGGGLNLCFNPGPSSPANQGLPTSWTVGLVPGVTPGTGSYYVSGPYLGMYRYQVASNLGVCTKISLLALLGAANALVGALITNASKWSGNPNAPNLRLMIANYNAYWRPLGGFTTAMAAIDWITAAAFFLGPAQLLLIATAAGITIGTIAAIIDCAANKAGGVFG